MRSTAQFCNAALLLLCLLVHAAAFTHPTAKVSARNHLQFQQRLFHPQKARCLVVPGGKLRMTIGGGYNSAPTAADNGAMVQAIPKQVKDTVIEALHNKDDLSLVAYIAEFYKDLFLKQKVGVLEQTVQQLLARVKVLEQKANAVAAQPKAPMQEKKPLSLARQSFSPIQQEQQPRQQQQLQPFQQQGRSAWQAYLRSTMSSPTTPAPASSGYQIPRQQPRQPATQISNARQNVKSIPVHRAADYDEFAAPTHHNHAANEVGDDYDDEYYDDGESEYDEFCDDDVEKVGSHDHHNRYSPQSHQQQHQQQHQHQHQHQHGYHEQHRRAEADQYSTNQPQRQPEIHSSAPQHAAYFPVQRSFHPQRSEWTTRFG